MAIIINDNFKLNVGKPLNSNYLNGLVPYSDISEVNTIIDISQRYEGLTVNINNVEYWYKDGVSDSNLVEKFILFTGGAVVVDAENIGTGSALFSGKNSDVSGDTLQFRTLVGSGNTNITTSGSQIIINTSDGTGDGSQIYTGTSLSNITVGGMSSGTNLFGKTLSEIIEDMLTTTYNPDLHPPNNTFEDVEGNIQEVGKTIPRITLTAKFNRGSISPQYSAISNNRSGLPNTYNYFGIGFSSSSVSSTSLTNVQTISNYKLLLGSNSWSSNVEYDAGVQPFDSNGNPFDSPLPAGITGTKTTTITGIYPWFYGSLISGSRPTPDQNLINDYDQKLVTNSSGNIVANYNANSAWIWFAIPETSQSKTKWEGSNSVTNRGNIGGAVSSGGSLFPSSDLVSINSPDGFWSGVTYKIYISNYPTSTIESGSPFTITFKN